jgi:predicted nucleotidyltransferase
MRPFLSKRASPAWFLQKCGQGRPHHYQANAESPIFEELRSIVLETSGLADPLREALEPLASHIDVAVLFGSVARGEKRADSDVDLLVVGGYRTATRSSASSSTDRRSTSSGTSMSSAALRNLARIGQLKEEPPDAAEIADLRRALKLEAAVSDRSGCVAHHRPVGHLGRSGGASSCHRRSYR